MLIFTGFFTKAVYKMQPAASYHHFEFRGYFAKFRNFNVRFMLDIFLINLLFIWNIIFNNLFQEINLGSVIIKK